MLYGVCCTVKRKLPSAHDLKGDEKHCQIVQNLKQNLPSDRPLL